MIVLDVHVGTKLTEQTKGIDVAINRSARHRSITSVIRNIDVCTKLTEHMNHLGETFVNRVIRRRVSVVITIVYIGFQPRRKREPQPNDLAGQR